MGKFLQSSGSVHWTFLVRVQTHISGLQKYIDLGGTILESFVSVSYNLAHILWAPVMENFSTFSEFYKKNLIICSHYWTGSENSTMWLLFDRYFSMFSYVTPIEYCILSIRVLPGFLDRKYWGCTGGLPRKKLFFEIRVKIFISEEYFKVFKGKYL